MINTHAIYIDKLNPAYQSVFRQISDYVMTANLDEVENEEILSEVLDTFLSAQNEGKAVEQIIGNDLKTFCEQLCSEKSVKNRIIRFFELLHPVFMLFTALCLFDFVDMLSGAEADFFTYRSSVSLSAYMTGCLIWIAAGCISNFFLKKSMFRCPKKYRLLAGIVRAVTIAVMFAALVFLFQGVETEGTYLWVSFVCCAGFLTVHRIVTRDSRRYKKENSISLLELTGASANVTADIESMEIKRFEKRNRRKNQPALSFDEFLDCEEQNCNSWDKKPGFHAGMAVGGTILGTVFTYFVGGFEHFYDLLVFVAILLAVEGSLMFGLYKAVDAGTKARMAWIKSKREHHDS